MQLSVGKPLAVNDVSLASRASWHTLMFGVIGFWVLAGIGVLIARAVGAPVVWWDLIHLFTIGALTTAIIVYSTHFAEALTRAATASYRAVALRIALVQVGLILLIIDRAGYDWGVLSDIGASLIVLALALHIWSIAKILRNSLANHFAVTVPFYIAASAFMIAAALLATLAGNGVGSYSQLIAAHQRAAVWGFAWLTVVATVITILPTLTGTKISALAKARCNRSLIVHCVGLSLSLVAYSLGYYPAGGLLQLTVVVSAIMIFIPVVSNVLGGSPTWSAPSLSVASGMLWLTAICAADALSVTAGTFPRVSTLVLVPAFLGGGILQMITGVLCFVTPTLRGGGPVMVTRGRALAATGWPARGVLINLGALLSIAGGVTPGIVMMGLGLAWAVIATVVSSVVPARRNP